MTIIRPQLYMIFKQNSFPQLVLSPNHSFGFKISNISEIQRYSVEKIQHWQLIVINSLENKDKPPLFFFYLISFQPSQLIFIFCLFLVQ